MEAPFDVGRKRMVALELNEVEDGVVRDFYSSVSQEWPYRVVDVLLSVGAEIPCVVLVIRAMTVIPLDCGVGVSYRVLGSMLFPSRSSPPKYGAAVVGSACKDG